MHTVSPRIDLPPNLIFIVNRGYTPGKIYFSHPLEFSVKSRERQRAEMEKNALHYYIKKITKIVLE